MLRVGRKPTLCPALLFLRTILSLISFRGIMTWASTQLATVDFLGVFYNFTLRGERQLYRKHVLEIIYLSWDLLT